jgi:hypothetical protein
MRPFEINFFFKEMCKGSNTVYTEYVYVNAV